MLIDGKGCWLSRCATFSPAPGRPALFLDRDNLVLHDPGFLHRADDVALMDGVASLITMANRAGWPVVIVSNQSGIARGLFDWDAFQAVNARMEEQLCERGAHLSLILACAWHVARHGPLKGAHNWRKPGTGMIEAAAALLGTDLARSWMAGDRISDISCARRAGIGRGMLVNARISRPASRRLADGFNLEIGPSLPALIGDLSRDQGVARAGARS